MKRMHVHVSVGDIPDAVRFYSALFAAQPSVVKADYAKWMLDDPRVNFAISTRGREPGLDHLGIQVERQDELRDVYGRLPGRTLGTRAVADTTAWGYGFRARSQIGLADLPAPRNDIGEFVTQ
jgi:hypothetical protein